VNNPQHVVDTPGFTILRWVSRPERSPRTTDSIRKQYVRVQSLFRLVCRSAIISLGVCACILSCLGSSFRVAFGSVVAFFFSRTLLVGAAALTTMMKKPTPFLRALVALLWLTRAAAQETSNTNSTALIDQLEQLAALATPPQLSEATAIGIQTLPCFPTFSPGDGQVEGENFTCGALSVPQNWNDYDNDNSVDTAYLDLMYAVAKATSENPKPDPLIYLAGGPGSSAILNSNMEKYQQLRSDRDIILLDIRGVGLSQRLGYDECLVLALQNDAPAEQVDAVAQAATQLLGKVTGQIAAFKPITELNLPLLNQICWEQFTTQGIDPNQFNTAAVARDVVELIQALGYASFNIDSVSYGTRLAMTIMNNLQEKVYNEAAPELRSVVLDSTFPPSTYLLRTVVRSDHDFMLQLLDECQADATCNQHYPNLNHMLQDLLHKLEQQPITSTDGEETVTLNQVVKELVGIGELRAAYIPKMIDELERGVLDTYQALRDGQIGTGSPEPELVTDTTTEEPQIDTNDPVQVFVADAAALLSGDDATVFGFYIELVLVEEDPLATLLQFISETYTGTIGDQMMELAETLTPEDFSNSAYVAQLKANAAATMDPEDQLATARSGLIGGIPLFLYTSIHCADDILHERFEDAVNSYNDLLFPQLTDLVKSQAQAGRCENWPVSAAPIEVKDPVNSTVPALILQGAYDKPTPIYMGRRAARELEQGSYVLVPQQGHWTWRNAQGCVGQIANAFIQDPESAAELNQSCLEARKPQWALPGNTTNANGETVSSATANKYLTSAKSLSKLSLLFALPLLVW